MRITVKYAVMVCFLIVVLVGIFIYEFPPYPAAYSVVNASMTEKQIDDLLTKEGFTRMQDQGVTDNWQKQTFFGMWYVGCGFWKGKAYYISACYRANNHTIRARSRDFRMGE